MAGYGDDSGLTAWLTANGYALPDGAPAPAVLRERGSVYIDGLYGARFTGVPTGGYAQERQWPRTGATAYGSSAIPDDVIPVAVVQASYKAAYQEAVSPGSLSVVVTAAGTVKREKVGPIEIEYQGASEDALAASTPLLSSIEGLLKPFLICSDTPAFGILSIGGPL